MIIDKIDGLDALERYDIRVVRAAYVDSAEGTIAFAARRDAEDDRAIPILLRGIIADHPMRGSTLLEGPLFDHESIRRAYDALSPNVQALGGRMLAQNFVQPGTDVVIAGRNEEGRKYLILRGAVHSVQRTTPLDEAGAELLALNFQGHHHHGTSEKTRRMLEHLLLRVSDFFEESGVESFELDPVRMREGNYVVLDATLRSQRPLTVKRRLEHDAHDRKGFEYHPSGRQ
jgi:hypothetical protein